MRECTWMDVRERTIGPHFDVAEHKVYGSG